ncbi:glycerate kinase [Amycolatopsis benzoatilytica]|uniref:glycerate kinase n=1 Tax=Amycolatopsis benzoatilytica TaxID=346045 RepID=UPI0003700F01|nr:glycerate kinase [Amycolatopsis benzoatilytica]
MTHQLRVLFAPDSFKGSASAAQVAAALAEGWQTDRPGDELILLPQADGGEGTAAVIQTGVPGAAWQRTPDSVAGPDGRPVPGRWLRLPDGSAVVELAQVCGLPMLRTPDPAGATTRGLGEVVRAAAASGAPSITVALGGSASTDGGAGALQALGACLTDRQGTELPLGGAALLQVDRADLTRLVPLPPGGVRLLTDTRTVLTGPDGAARVFGPQKGATPDEVARLDAALARFGAVLGACSAADPHAPGSGAAGGTAFGLSAWGGSIVDGANAIAELSGLTALLDRIDVLVTGEGCFDATSATGKLVGSLLSRCRAHRVQPVIVAGRLAIQPPAIGTDLTVLAGSAEAAMAEPLRWLRIAGAVIAQRFTAGLTRT